MREAGPGDFAGDIIEGEILEFAEDIRDNRPHAAKATLVYILILCIPLASFALNPFIMLTCFPNLDPGIYGGTELQWIWMILAISTALALIGLIASLMWDDPRKPVWIPRLGSLAALVMDGLAILLFSMMP